MGAPEGERDTLAEVVFVERDAIQEAESLRKAHIAHAQPRVGWLRIKANYRYRETRSEGTVWYWANHGVWVTCAHLFPSDRPQNLEIEVWDSQGNCRALQHYWRDSLLDVAFLPDSAQAGFLLEEERRLQAGDWCFMMGAPLGLAFSFQEGYVVSAHRVIGGQTYLQLSFWAAPGSSGSPVLNRRARLTGMITDIAEAGGPGSGIVFALPEAAIREAYQRYTTFASHDPARAD